MIAAHVHRHPEAVRVQDFGVLVIPCDRSGSNKGLEHALAMLPAPDTTVPATVPAALAELVALSTRLVTTALRRYQITGRRIALGRLLRFGTQGSGRNQGPSEATESTMRWNR